MFALDCSDVRMESKNLGRLETRERQWDDRLPVVHLSEPSTEYDGDDGTPQHTTTVPLINCVVKECDIPAVVLMCMRVRQIVDRPHATPAFFRLKTRTPHVILRIWELVL